MPHAMLNVMLQPRFDHNLRTSEGDTPLMVACSIGKLQILKFLLESAVYPQSRQECEHEEDSDADSGVLDPTSGMTQRRDSKSALGENKL